MQFVGHLAPKAFEIRAASFQSFSYCSIEPTWALAANSFGGGNNRDSFITLTIWPDFASASVTSSEWGG